MNDQLIVDLITSGRIRVDQESGNVFATRSNTPNRPVGALTKKGYLRLCVTLDGRQRHFMVHRIVWVSVHGVLPDGYEVDHRNRNKTDNRISNLEAVPGAVNMFRAKSAGAFKANGRKDDSRDNNGRFGKKAAGRQLDGRTWDEVPQLTTAQ